MTNAFARVGRTCVSMMIAGGLSAVAMLASPVEMVSVTLPHSVSVGSTILAEGSYQVTSLHLASGAQFFLFRPEHGASVMVPARLSTGEAADRTSVQFSTGGEQWHLQKLSIAGDTASYAFDNSIGSEK